MSFCAHNGCLPFLLVAVVGEKHSIDRMSNSKKQTRGIVIAHLFDCAAKQDVAAASSVPPGRMLLLPLPRERSLLLGRMLLLQRERSLSPGKMLLLLLLPGEMSP